MDIKAVTEEHIRMMLHCIGLDYKKPQRGKYKAYRNYCFYSAKNWTAEHLVNCGYMELHVEHEPTVIPHDQFIYSLTRAGMDFLGSIIGAEITEAE